MLPVCGGSLPAFAQPATATLPTAVTEKPAPDSLTQTLVSAYLFNPRLKAEREALALADEGVALAASGFRPTAIAEYDKGRQRTSVNSSAERYNNAETKALTVNQPVFNGGSTLADFKAAKAEVKAARAQLTAIEQLVLLDAVTAHANMIATESELQLNQNNLNVLEKQLESTTARFKAGELTRTDEAQAQARLAMTQAELRQAEANLKSARAAYIEAVGIEPLSLSSSATLPSLPATLQAALDQAATMNPDLARAKFTENSARYRVHSRVGDLLPNVALQGSMDRTKGNRFLGGTSSYDSDAITVNVAIPLYQSGAEYARLRAARNTEQQAHYTTLQVRNAMVQSVTSAFENYQASLLVIESTKESVRASDVALTGVRKENDYGVRTILDVLNAEQEAFASKVNLVRAQRDNMIRAYALLASMGELTAERLALPVELYDKKAHYKNTWWKPVGF